MSRIQPEKKRLKEIIKACRASLKLLGDAEAAAKRYRKVLIGNMPEVKRVEADVVKTNIGIGNPYGIVIHVKDAHEEDPSYYNKMLYSKVDGFPVFVYLPNGSYISLSLK